MVAFGNQDTGSIVGVLGESGSFGSVSTADGSDVLIDHKSDSDFIYVYHGFQNFGFLFRTSFSKRDFVSLTCRR